MVRETRRGFRVLNWPRSLVVHKKLKLSNIVVDAELAKDFKTIVSFQGNKGKPAYSWYKYKEAFSAGR